MAYGIRASGDTPGADSTGPPSPAGLGSAEQAAVLSAVREDVRQTLRAGWVDPALDAAAAHPVFFTAAWSAIRPNVGKTFLQLSRTLRSQAADAVTGSLDLPNLRKRLEGELGEEELRRVEDAARAAHLATPKVQLVVHALLRAARRERIPGTGREEPPVRRGVPDWQRWMAFNPAAEATWPMPEEVQTTPGLWPAPAVLRMVARWPAALTVLWDHLGPFARSEAWPAIGMRLRRTVLQGIETLPHPVELQWMALRERGFSEQDQEDLGRTLATHDAVMAHHSAAAAFAWLAFGGPEMGSEG